MFNLEPADLYDITGRLIKIGHVVAFPLRKDTVVTLQLGIVRSFTVVPGRQKYNQGKKYTYLRLAVPEIDTDHRYKRIKGEKILTHILTTPVLVEMTLRNSTDRVAVLIGMKEEDVRTLFLIGMTKETRV